MTEVRAHARKGTRGVRPHIRLVRRRDSRIGWYYGIRENGVEIGAASIFNGSPDDVDEPSKAGDVTLFDFSVDAEHQNRGVGTAAIHELMADLRQRGYKRMFAESPTPDGDRLYSKVGFQWVPGSDHGGRDVGAMVKRLR